LALCSINIVAQQFRDISKKIKIDNCKYFITYNHKYIIDTIKKNTKYDKQALEIGYNISHYYSLYADIVDSVWHNASNKSGKPNKDGSDGINPYKEAGLQQNEFPKYEDYYINYPEKGTLKVVIAIFYKDFVYEEPIPKFEWKLQADTTTILGYKCIKATTTFRGRDYEVWFTPFIPIRQGPWKFSGLPGLILKAKDTKGYFEWLATGIEKPDNRKIYAYNFDKNEMQKTIRQDIIILLHQRWKDPIGLTFALNPNIQSSGYKDGKTGKFVFVNRGDKVNYQQPYIPIPELE
jgi:GLPGLI family protein